MSHFLAVLSSHKLTINKEIVEYVKGSDPLRLLEERKQQRTTHKTSVLTTPSSGGARRAMAADIPGRQRTPHPLPPAGGQSTHAKRRSHGVRVTASQAVCSSIRSLEEEDNALILGFIGSWAISHSNSRVSPPQIHKLHEQG